MKRNFFKTNKKGITLIALIITIILLLILAGVSISMISGENGILAQASKAKLENEKAQIIEEIELAVIASRLVEGKYGKIDEDKLREELGKIGIPSPANIKVIDDGDNTDGQTLPWEVTKKGDTCTVTYRIDEDGKVTFIRDGDTIDSKIWTKDVSFTPENEEWGVENVQEALDYLYNN